MKPQKKWDYTSCVFYETTTSLLFLFRVVRKVLKKCPSRKEEIREQKVRKKTMKYHGECSEKETSHRLYS